MFSAALPEQVISKHGTRKRNLMGQSIGETTRQKVYLLLYFAPELSLPLVQSNFANVNLMKAKLWGNVNGKVYGFLYTS
jgi:hypothetical protein